MASPHVAGLLAYLLSLQPAADSAYAVAEITPAKLKAQLLAISTKGALTNVPTDTANVLAWNGGGSANYTEIISKGGYTVGKDSVETVQDRVTEIKEEAAEIIKEVTGKLEDFLVEELKSLKSHY